MNFCYIADDEAPILNCANISSTTDEGLNSSSTVLLDSTATDNVDFHLDVNCSHSSADIFLLGDTTVNCSSTDDAGNTGTCLLCCHSNRCECDYSLYLKVLWPIVAKDFGIFNFLWKMNRHEFACVLHFLISRSFWLDLTFWIIWKKLWSWNQNVSYYYFLNSISCSFSSISSPLKLTNMIRFLEICIDVISLNCCYICRWLKHLFWYCPNISSTTDEGRNSSSTVLLNSTATDDKDFHLDVNCSHSSQDTYPIGDTTVNCSSTDDAGNTGTCLLVVTVTGVNMIILCI